MEQEAFYFRPANVGPKFENQPVKLKAPEEIAAFSYDEDRELHLDSRSLNYYFNPSPRGTEGNINLADGFDTFRRADDTLDEHLTGLLAAIMEKEKKDQAKLNAKFISFRGMMTNLLTLPYCYRADDWRMNLTFFDGTIFIEEDKSYKLEKKKEKESRGKFDDRMNFYYGFKFETMFTIPDTWDNVSREEIENRNEKIVSNVAQYCSVVRTEIGEMSMIIGGEVDCIWDGKLPGETRHNYVELKQTRWIDPRLPRHRLEREHENYDFRKLKYWAQSYLIGCPRIVVGKRDTRTNRLVPPLDVFDVLDLPKASTKWNARVCKQTWAGLLEWLWDRINGTTGVWQLEKAEHQDCVRLIRRETAGTGQILTDEFVAHRLALAGQAPAAVSPADGVGADAAVE